MAENKKSFILYSDFREVFTELSDQDAGQLIKHIFQYVNDENPVTENPIVKMCFIPIKLALKRDLKKWDKYIKKQRDNGKRGGRPAKPNETQKTQAFYKKPKKADSVNVSVSVNDSKREGFAPPAKEEVINEMMLKLDDFTAMGEADKFMNNYETKGWVVGRAKMKNWKSAVRMWISRMGEFKKPVIQMKTEPDQNYRYEKL